MARSTHIVLECRLCDPPKRWTWARSNPHRPKCMDHIGTPLTVVGEKALEDERRVEEMGDPEQ